MTGGKSMYVHLGCVCARACMYVCMWMGVLKIEDSYAYTETYAHTRGRVSLLITGW